MGLLVLAPLPGGLAAGALLALGAGYAAVVVAGVLAQREPPYPMCRCAVGSGQLTGDAVRP